MNSDPCCELMAPSQLCQHMISTYNYLITRFWSWREWIRSAGCGACCVSSLSHAIPSRCLYPEKAVGFVFTCGWWSTKLLDKAGGEGGGGGAM